MTAAPPAAAASAPASETVFARLKDEILTAVLAGGEMISEGEVAERFGVSRTPVREAFLRLEAAGYLRLYPKRGALVEPVHPGEADDVYEARQLLESHAAERLARETDDLLRDLVAELRSLVAAQEVALDDADLDTYTELDLRFHHRIVEAAGNPLLVGFHTTLRERQARLVATALRGGRRVPSEVGRLFVSGHAALVEAISHRDPADFRAVLARHLADSRGDARSGTAL
ncbi:GntR family transcriptional regulator [Antribacter gilvus]|uniref:GntR family transcriptional regulator n=1 Tax=Antribacter gilvus TaxID=2304675 RepID=UPI0013DF9CC2|nr:GntR family transcriptional regulator [Antribacter gilvus]